MIDNVSSCKISPGYSHNKTFGRQVVFQFQNASEDNEGHYVCQIIPSKGESSVNHCQFQLNGEAHRERVCLCVCVGGGGGRKRQKEKERES